LEKAKKTKDFISLAKQYSQSARPQRVTSGGSREEDLGRGGWSALLDEGGDVSGVIGGKTGFSIFKIEEVVDEKIKPLEEVQDRSSTASRWKRRRRRLPEGR